MKDKAIVSTRVCGQIGPDDFEMFPEIKEFSLDEPISNIFKWSEKWGFGKEGVTHGNLIIQRKDED